MTDFHSQFHHINPIAPWLQPLADIHRAFAHDGTLPLYHWLNRYFAQQRIALVNHQGQPLSFTHQNDLAHGTAYEAHIGTHHTIPTRDNLHDWFGACVWSLFTKSKALLNAKHIAHLAHKHSGNQRSRLRDTITVFDENGAVLVVSDDGDGQRIAQALTQFDWQGCLIDSRAQWHNPHSPSPDDKAQLFIFGHALLEQLTCPRKDLCSHTLIIHVPAAFFALDLPSKLTALDEHLCQALDELLIDGVTPRQLNPLPILGVPHFWADNQQPEFYQDSFVFRSGRRKPCQHIGVLSCSVNASSPA